MRNAGLLFGGVVGVVLSLGASRASGVIGSAAQSRTCKPIAEPKEIPSVGAFFDSVALAAALPSADSLDPPERVLTVVRGARPRLLVNDSDSPRFNADVGQKILASLKPAAKSAPAFRLAIASGPSPNLTIERSVLCDPEVVGGEVVKTLQFSVEPARGSGGPPPVRPRPVTPRLKIGLNGEVLDVDLGTGSGNPDLDRSLAQSLQKQHYRPALLDGHPVVVTLKAGKAELIP